MEYEENRNLSDDTPSTAPFPNHDSFTESQDLLEFTPSPPKPWGFLYPNNSKYTVVELTKEEYTLGREVDCDICVHNLNLESGFKNSISKVHFKIMRERVEGSNFLVYIEDKSFNGTYVNKEKIGKGKRVILENNDVISLSQSNYKVYIFMSGQGYDGDDLPTEVKTKYAVSRKLGSGVCGEVKLVFTKVGGRRFAMKVISMKKLTNGNLQNEPQRIMNEVEILRKLRHPCIIRTEEVFNFPHAVYIILELMEGGELFNRIRNSLTGLPDDVSKMIFYQVALAVQYLHSQGITHRDLKPENILLASDEVRPLVKVTDFGLSKVVDTDTMMRTMCGTMLYVAPEVLLTNGKGAYTSQVDVWSLGVILYVMLSAVTPFTNNNKHSGLVEQITRGTFNFPTARFSKVNCNAKELIKSMLTIDPLQRFTMDQVLKNDWLLDYKMRFTVHDMFRKLGDFQNWSVFVQNQLKMVRPKFNMPFVMPMVKRPRLE